MTEIELLSYLLMFALSIIFSSFTVERKSSIFSFLSMIAWFMLAICHVALASESIFIELAYFFAGLGVFFMVLGFGFIFTNIQMRRQEEEWEVA